MIQLQLPQLASNPVLVTLCGDEVSFEYERYDGFDGAGKVVKRKAELLLPVSHVPHLIEYLESSRSGTKIELELQSQPDAMLVTTERRGVSVTIYKLPQSWRRREQVISLPSEQRELLIRHLDMIVTVTGCNRQRPSFGL